jgi:starvation-inducible DNA-binding protein
MFEKNIVELMNKKEMETTTKNKKRLFAKLGYSHLDTAEIVTRLNQVLTDYNIILHKLRNYHWNVKGADFFELHRLFGNMSDQMFKETDLIAEKIRLFGKQPLGTLREYLKHTKIEESNAENIPMEMVKDILSDLSFLLAEIEDSIISAQNISDFGTESMLKSFIVKHEREYWMLSSWLNQNIV